MDKLPATTSNIVYNIDILYLYETMNALRYLQRVTTTTAMPLNRDISRYIPVTLLVSDSFQASTLLYQQQHQYYNQIQHRYMSKYVSKSMKKNLPLTTKRARKGFYKGKGGTKEGRINSIGRFVINPLKRLQLVVPQDLSNFRLKPYIASSASRFPPEDRHNSVPS